MIEDSVKHDDPTSPLPAGWSPPELSTNAPIGEYRVVSHLSEGGFGVVYLVEHRLLHRRAAAKILHRHLACRPGALQRFLLEAQAVNRIHHPGIVDIFDFGILPDERPYFIMELVDGVDLEHRLRATGPMSPAEALDLLEQICDALGAAHAAGFIHRDVKASNVLVTEQPDGGLRAKLIDFGVAKLLPPGADAATTASLVGTPTSMAPEQIRGDGVSPQTDVYAVGVMLYHMLTGRLPFQAQSASELSQLHLEADAPRPSLHGDVPVALDAVVVRCLSKRAEDRYASMAELRDAARAALHGSPTTTTTKATRPAEIVEARALALFIELRGDATPRDADGDDDGALLDRVAARLDDAEAAVSALGGHVVFRSATAALFVLIAPPSPAEAARHLSAIAVSATAGATALHAHLHADEVEVRGGLPFGGSLLRVHTWPATRGGIETDAFAALSAP